MSDKKFESVALSAVDKELREMEPAIRRRDPETTPRPVSSVPVNRDYAELERILKLAFDQAASGKGHKRHAKDFTAARPWEDQQSMQISRAVGPGYPSGQVSKKAQEAVAMAGNGDFETAKADALGLIIYGAMLYKLLDEMEAARAKKYD